MALNDSIWNILKSMKSVQLQEKMLTGLLVMGEGEGELVISFICGSGSQSHLAPNHFYKHEHFPLMLFEMSKQISLKPNSKWWFFLKMSVQTTWVSLSSPLSEENPLSMYIRTNRHPLQMNPGK